MAIASSSPSTPSFVSASLCCSRAAHYLASPCFPSTTPISSSLASTPRFPLSPRLNSCRFSGGSVSPDGGDVQYEVHHVLCGHRLKGSPVYVTLPVDVLGPAGQLRRRKAMAQSFRALVASGVEGVVMEVWWGLVERDEPGVYNWRGYLEIVELAVRFGLKVRAMMAFHQCGQGPGDPHWIPLPLWVLEEIDKYPDLTYSDKFGRRSMEYISLGCDNLPILRGRSPIQAYTDLMRSFRDTFLPSLGDIITGILVGMGPAGELRYPSCPSHKLMWSWRSRELGEFQCYDKHMLASLNACAREAGMREWGNGGPLGASNLMQNPEQTDFFRTENGAWDTPYGNFFLEWYSGLLLLHGERICREAETIFRGVEVRMSAKVAGIHWHYSTQSHASELTSGYYNTSTRDGYLPIARMFGRYGFTLCSPCFEMRDVEEKQLNPVSSPEGFIRQLLSATRVCDIPLEGENSGANFDDKSFQQVVKMSRFYSGGVEKPSFTFNFVRMDKNMFEYQHWVRFTRFVRQMSVANIFRAKLDFGGDMRSFDIPKVRLGFAYS